MDSEAPCEVLTAEGIYRYPMGTCPIDKTERVMVMNHWRSQTDCAGLRGLRFLGLKLTRTDWYTCSTEWIMGMSRSRKNSLQQGGFRFVRVNTLDKQSIMMVGCDLESSGMGVAF